MDVLVDAPDDGVVLVAELALVAQVGPEEHGHDDDQQADDGYEQDVGVMEHTSVILGAKIGPFFRLCNRSDEFTDVFRRIHG